MKCSRMINLLCLLMIVISTVSCIPLAPPFTVGKAYTAPYINQEQAAYLYTYVYGALGRIDSIDGDPWSDDTVLEILPGQHKILLHASESTHNYRANWKDVSRAFFAKPGRYYVVMADKVDVYKGEAHFEVVDVTDKSDFSNFKAHISKYFSEHGR